MNENETKKFVEQAREVLQQKEEMPQKEKETVRVGDYKNSREKHSTPQTVFEKIARHPKTLGYFLQMLQVAEGPWDMWFQKKYCSQCQETDCDQCQREERNNPTLWLISHANESVIDIQREDV